jgi:hypothetical protein
MKGEPMIAMLKKTHVFALTGVLAFTATPVALASDSAMPASPEQKSEEVRLAQPSVDKQSSDTTAEMRKKVLDDAKSAIEETEKALKALEDEKPDEALQSLALATGKLELILARDPELALAPTGVAVVTYDVLANQKTIKTVIEEAKQRLNEGKVQQARKLMTGLASEIEYRTTNIPLATYPAAIKGITPLIDAGKLGEAKAGLRAALNTLVVTTEAVPLPKLRAEHFVNDAQTLAEKKDRSAEDSDRLKKDLGEARKQIELAELLGYGNKKAYQPIYEQIDKIEEKINGNKSGRGFFEKAKTLLGNLFSVSWPGGWLGWRVL